jgi:hypothetical protein
MDKEIVFISHATHDDDYYAGWLASKLQALGYKIFIDLDNLRAGDTFFTVIQPIIQKEAYKFITLNTKNYISKAADPNSGVRKEINAAATIKSDLNFIIPIRFDDTDFNLFPMDYVGRKSIDFNKRWKEGLDELVNELEEFKTPQNNLETNPLKLWHKAVRVNNLIISAPETIFTNWFPIELPEYIYIHKPANLDKTSLGLIPSTTILESNHIISFASTETVSECLPLLDSKKVLTEEFISEDGLPINQNFTLLNPSAKLKNLLNKSFKAHCKWKGLKVYYQSGEKEVYYFQFRDNKPLSISLKKYGRSRIQLVGRKEGKNWHFAINAKTELLPFPHYRLFYHIIFTDEKYNLFEISQQHIARRGFASSLYNKKTFELLVGSMLALSPNIFCDSLLIKIDTDKHLKVDNKPLSFSSNTSYREP